MRDISQDETLAGLISALWTARFYVVVGGLIGFIAAVIIVLTAVPHMRVEMVVAPVLDHKTSGDFDLEASHAQNDEPLAFLRYLNILKGPAIVTQTFNVSEDLQKNFRQPKRFSFQGSEKFKDMAHTAFFIKRNIHIRRVGNTPLRIIEMDSHDPALVKNLMNLLHQTADQAIRQETLARTKERVRYLEETLSRTANPDHRRALTELLLEQERLQMMASMGTSFAATIIEPPYTHARPVWPRKSYIFPILVLMGMVMGWIIFGVVRTHEQNSS